MLTVRRSHAAFGRGTLRFLYPKNRKVLAYLREYQGETDPVRRQRLAHAAGGRARPVRIRRPGADRDERRLAVPADRPAHLSADPAAVRLLLVHPRQGERCAVVAHAGARTDARLRHAGDARRLAERLAPAGQQPARARGAAGLSHASGAGSRPRTRTIESARIAYTARLPGGDRELLLAEIETRSTATTQRWQMPLSIVVGGRDERAAARPARACRACAAAAGSAC